MGVGSKGLGVCGWGVRVESGAGATFRLRVECPGFKVYYSCNNSPEHQEYHFDQGA